MEGTNVDFAEFAGTALPGMLRYAMVLAGRRELAEDLVQEVFTKVFAQWSTVSSAQSPQAYVRRMVSNEFISQHRKHGRVHSYADVPTLDEVPDPGIATADQLFLMQQLATLPAHQRVVLTLRYYGGLSDHEIAQELRCRPGTVRGYASRALKTLRINNSDPDPVAVLEV